MRDRSANTTNAIVIVVLIAGWLVLAGCSSSPPASRPTQLADRFALEEGKRLFEKYCSPCHGPGGRGDGRFFASSLSPPPADLASPEFARSRSDAQLGQVISHGSAAVGKSDLCPVWGLTFSPTEVEYLVACIRKLQRQAASETVR